jgi:hypothetical protein
MLFNGENRMNMFFDLTTIVTILPASTGAILYFDPLAVMQPASIGLLSPSSLVPSPASIGVLPPPIIETVPAPISSIVWGAPTNTTLPIGS